MLETAITLSIVFGFIISEALGILSGGLVSAGYLAFFIDQPLRIAATLGLSIFIALLVNSISQWLILFGRRRFVLTILLSLVAAWLFERFSYRMNLIPQDMRIIGYLIPGLIANDMVRQGVIKTLLALLMNAAVIKLVMLAILYL